MTRLMLKTLAKGFTAALLVLLPLTLGPAAVHAQQTASYDYHQPTEMMVNYGRQALMICNGLFVSNRSLDLIYEQELKLNRMPVLPPSMVTIDKERQAVVVGGGGNSPYRGGSAQACPRRAAALYELGSRARHTGIRG